MDPEIFVERKPDHLTARPFSSGLWIWCFEARAQAGTDGGSIISMLAHLPCLLIERPRHLIELIVRLFTIFRVPCPLSIFPI